MANWKSLVRCGFYACVMVIIVLSLLPAQDMYRTAAPKWAEHFVAYWGTGLLMAIAFPLRSHKLKATLALMALAGAMELLQELSPGRTAHLGDFVVSSLGAVMGAVMGSVVGQLVAFQRLHLRP